jgi:hypothetical protein
VAERAGRDAGPRERSPRFADRCRSRRQRSGRS